MKMRLTNLFFVVMIALAIGGGAYLLTTSTHTEELTPSSDASAAGTGAGPAEHEEGEGAAPLTAPEPAAYDTELVAKGAEVYAANCQVCHGGSGNGDGAWAEVGMDVPPRDFTDSEWMSSQSDGVFYTSIQRGVPGTAMPSFADRLSEKEIWAAVAYIRGLSPRVALDAPMGSEDVEKGKELYAATCAGCHGANGDGEGDAAAAFGTQPRALNNPGWLNSKSDDELINTVTQGLPNTAMPAFGDQLTYDDTRSIVRYLRQMAGVPQREHPQQGGWAERTYQAYCASCHGVDGDGEGPAAGRLDPEPRNFRNPQWMAGQSAEGLAEVIGEGRHGTAMPPFAALLTEDERTRVAKYIMGFSSPEAMPGADSANRYSPAPSGESTSQSSSSPAADR
ncbi:c-type cytochrome [Janibacter cremeus]|uniref:cytochrome c n=1 Tax=Janibacter cremeus TaxID=1285192 RepID=UPI0023F9DC9F|nr:cytochrome c [Janibacter cremeus]WEV78796.1 c-type cytochrome [Janibacter cremeus]